MDAKNRNFGALALVLGAAWVCPAAAETPAVPTIPYLSGGIGKEERARIQQQQGRYNVHLEFITKPRWTYLAGVRVNIRDKAGKVIVDAVSDGPWFLLKLPEGKYTATVEARGISIDRKIHVAGAGPVKLDFIWPSE